MTAVLRRPLLAIPVILTALTGLAILGVAVGTLVANSRMFGIGVAAMLSVYGIALIAFAWLVVRGQRWALGLIVASSLLHAMVVYSLLGTDDRAQFIGALAVAPFILATVVTSVVAVGRGELEKL
ncbi:hypothetical protein H5392_06315 [Tessaracoccus sp. MC1865]|uniref:hypothetical protein n=1 Tax=Tessaracoccus sp. MC1865 TaxID=2760310 RepID=UPI00160471B5|nr:hypothetical protein [Tessaracoccus sp. MC1865]MBB1483473.1 hypothetical protein [Tessaracoccus sp. MC1865]QTO36572.1 hypothetical protein J7D54_08690 [Tessaracoccus sp. MC1865]